MKTSEIMQAWGKILRGGKPSLSIEITRECPLRCPGCYAYGENHLGTGTKNLRSLADYKGEELISRVVDLVEEHKPLHLSIVGGDPLVRFRELDTLLPILTGKGVHVQLVTSAFRKIPLEWAKLLRLNVVVSVDGLAPEHDLRRRPATYEKILRSIEGHKDFISIHCTITQVMLRRTGYLSEFVDFWSFRPEAKRIWFSMFTPQVGEISNEIIPKELREQAVGSILQILNRRSKLDMAPSAVMNFLTPPSSPRACTFARTTHTISADLKTRVTPCQFGGNPDCSQCGCIASVALHAVAQHKLLGIVSLKSLFDVSLKVGELVAGRALQPTYKEPEISGVLPVIQR